MNWACEGNYGRIPAVGGEIMKTSRSLKTKSSRHRQPANDFKSIELKR